MQPSNTEGVVRFPKIARPTAYQPWIVQHRDQYRAYDNTDDLHRDLADLDAEHARAKARMDRGFHAAQWHRAGRLGRLHVAFTSPAGWALLLAIALCFAATVLP
jgi:hypothetical protein